MKPFRGMSRGHRSRRHLEATETEITTFEEEFLSYIVLPANQTVGEYMETSAYFLMCLYMERYGL